MAIDQQRDIGHRDTSQVGSLPDFGILGLARHGLSAFQNGDQGLADKVFTRLEQIRLLREGGPLILEDPKCRW